MCLERSILEMVDVMSQHSDSFNILFRSKSNTNRQQVHLFLGFLGLFLALGFLLLLGLECGFLLGLHDLHDDLLFFDEEGSGDSSLECVSTDATAISSVDGLCTSGSSAWLKSGWSSSFHTLEGLAGVTALGYGSALAGVQEHQFSAWRFADFALVGAGVPRQSAAVLNSLHHFVYLSVSSTRDSRDESPC